MFYVQLIFFLQKFIFYNVCIKRERLYTVSTARSHSNSYIFYKVANSYELVRPHSYKFLVNRTYFTSCQFIWIYMNDLHLNLPVTGGLDKGLESEVVRICHLVKYIQIGREIALVYIYIYIYIYSQVHKYWDIDTILTFLALYTTTMDFKWNEQDVL